VECGMRLQQIRGGRWRRLEEDTDEIAEEWRT